MLSTTEIRPHAFADVVRAAKAWVCLQCQCPIPAKSFYFKVQAHSWEGDKYPRHGEFCGPECLSSYFEPDFCYQYPDARFFGRFADKTINLKLTQAAKEYLRTRGYGKLPSWRKRVDTVSS